MTQYRYELGLFEKTGVELEYMIVDRDTLSVKAIADQLFKQVAGEAVSDIEPADPETGIAWSNELALHVVEFKTPVPVPALEPLPHRFQEQVRRVNALLEPMNARLLPTGMHPWMDPHTEMRLWPHEFTDIYRTFDRIFSCKGHGWANLQSTHINLPFADDAEFGRLHAAVRLVLPLLPALAASTPVMDGRVTGVADNRLEVYRNNAAKVPSVTAMVVPEPVYTRAAYEGELLGGIYRDMQLMDPEGILRHEWVNARGCIARFMRGSIEIRLIDLQECPLADLAVVALVRAAVQAMVDERWLPCDRQKQMAVEPMHALLLSTIRDAETAVIDDPDFLSAWGQRKPVTAGEVWHDLVEQLLDEASPWRGPLRTLLSQGTLSTRITRRLGEAPTRHDLHSVYSELADCLHHGRFFDAG